MALRPASHALIVEPSLVDNDESETSSGLHVVRQSPPLRKVWRGVIRAVGAHVQEGAEVGHVAHYTDFVPIGELHVVPVQNLLAWEDNE